jgi:hypothetical protein
MRSHLGDGIVAIISLSAIEKIRYVQILPRFGFKIVTRDDNFVSWFVDVSHLCRPLNYVTN